MRRLVLLVLVVVPAVSCDDDCQERVFTKVVQPDAGAPPTDSNGKIEFAWCQQNCMHSESSDVKECRVHSAGGVECSILAHCD